MHISSLGRASHVAQFAEAGVHVRVMGESRNALSPLTHATVVAYSQSLDLELWKLDGIADPLPIVEVNTSGWTRIEDRVMVIGSPEQGGGYRPSPLA